MEDGPIQDASRLLHRRVLVRLLVKPSLTKVRSSAQAALTHVAWACLSGICASMTLSTAAVVFSNCPRFFHM